MLQAFRNKPIGIFDSGVGGLTVMREIVELLPHEDIIYLGDTARVPYGVRSSETVLKYSMENTHFLMEKGIKLLVIACNTSSAVSLDILEKRFEIPIIGVVNPGARAAVNETRTKRVAVIGTAVTINSGSYERAIKATDESVAVCSIACPLLVPIIEEGWLYGDVVTLAVREYLSRLKDDSVDSLVLGCTHYPMIKHIIKDVLTVSLIDSAIETAKEVKRVLAEQDLLSLKKDEPVRQFFVTDAPEKFARSGELFLGQRLSHINRFALAG